MTPRTLLRGIVAVLTVALVAACGGAGDGATDDARLPAIELIGLDDGAAAMLDEPSDAPRVINLWASWCAPCRSELPAFDEVATELGDAVAVLGVNVGEDPDTATALVDELGITFPQRVDPASEITAALEIAGLPATVFTTADGRILDVHGGTLDADELRTRIDELFGVTSDV